MALPLIRLSTRADIDAWRALARTVEPLFGAAMADATEWNAHLERNIDRGTAWCAVREHDRVMGGVWLAPVENRASEIRWLAVASDARGHGAGRALVLHAIAHGGVGRVHVVTFGPRHPLAGEAEPARRLFRGLGFMVEDRDVDSPDGTPRERLVWHGAVLGDGELTLRPLALADAMAHKAGEDDAQLRAFGFPGPAPFERVVAAIREWQAAWVVAGPVRNWGIRRADTDDLVGNTEVRVLERATVNVSYVVFPDFRRQGIATRASRLALAYARDELGARRARIEVLPDNVASLGVVRNLGATFAGRGTNQAGRDLDAYELEL